MSNILFAFITLHFMGDYYLQPRRLANLKDKNVWGVFIHSILYSIPALVSLLLVKGNGYGLGIIILCGMHFVVDIIKFFIKPVFYVPKDTEKGNTLGQHLLRIDIRYFIDQFVHLMIIIAISIVFLRNHSDIRINLETLNVMNLRIETLVTLLKAVAAFIVVLQPVSLTFYKIFNIDALVDARAPKNAEGRSRSLVDIKGAGAIIGFLERSIMLCLLILGEYTAIGFIIAGKSIIRLHSNVKQEFFIIGTFYGMITTIVTYLLFFVI
jgi:hypothetical protein